MAQSRCAFSIDDELGESNQPVTRIDKFVSNHSHELVSRRRWFHQHPEIAYYEEETANYILDQLRQLGVQAITRAAKTGVICDIGVGSPTVLCRFNMDALPIPEKTSLTYSSLNDGYSHACGHDFELAWGLMLAKYYQAYPPNGTVRLVFQPAEEDPGDDVESRTGGQWLAQLGIFDGVDGAFSLHVDPELPVGTLSIVEGPVTASAFDFDIAIRGKACHAAKPHQGLNPIPYAGRVIDDLAALETGLRARIGEDGFVLITPSQVASRVDLDSPEAGSRNTIPEHVFISGITRVRPPQMQTELLVGLERICEKYRDLIDCSIKVVKRAPATVNDSRLVPFVREVGSRLGLTPVEKVTSWRDDAGWCSEKAPTAHGFVGVETDNQSVLHSPYFNPDERGLQIGLKVLIGATELFLASPSSGRLSAALDN
ncbi:MAG: M20 family metallopeptidase [Acidobacteriota bacterium]